MRSDPIDATIAGVHAAVHRRHQVHSCCVLLWCVVQVLRAPCAAMLLCDALCAAVCCCADVYCFILVQELTTAAVHTTDISSTRATHVGVGTTVGISALVALVALVVAMLVVVVMRRCLSSIYNYLINSRPRKMR